MANNNYYVIGGQYYQYCYGGRETMLGAKRLATQSEEYWDNWQGWHRPAVYAAEDCYLADTQFHGRQMIHRPDAQPVAVWDARSQRWSAPAEVC